MHKTFSAHNLLCPPRATLLGTVGLSPPEAFAFLCRGLKDVPLASMVATYKAASRAAREAGEEIEPLYEGAKAAVEQLAARPDMVLGIATGKSQRGVQTVLGHHGLIGLFSTIKTAEDAPSKPHPGMVFDAMREVGVAPADTIVVGD